jgi:hypothetical protein
MAITNPNHQRLDLERFQRVIDHGSVAEVRRLRTELAEKKRAVDAQLADDTADERIEIAEMVHHEGLDLETAKLRALAEGDNDWRARATSFARLLDAWLGKIRVRLAEIDPPIGPAVWRASVMVGAGVSAMHAANAINDVIARGCKVGSALAIGDDLVVVATEPKS